MNFNKDEPAGVLVKTTLVDFPGLVACSFFLPGCNLRCPYCYNTDLAVGKLPEDIATASLNQLFAHLEKRQNVLQGLAISGGEALLSPLLPEIIKKARSLGYKIKLDTNGTLPDQLQKIISNSETTPDFIAMDIKTSIERYSQLLPSSTSTDISTQVIRSIQQLSVLPTEKREFRTVLVPALISKQEIESLAKILPHNASWQFAQFRNENCLNPEYSNIHPYTDQEVLQLVDFAKTFIPGTNLR